ncbi:MAG TPA: dephospho-CoA kinase [Burkholderiaceae bacterium]|nr:dephospho-CoA kinase [Burkholderiaceae bacterium]
MLIGLTGGIGSGKSAVADALQMLGADVIDADAISHALTASGGAALPAIRAAFGDEAIATDGALHRAWMRERVFADEHLRQQLNGILHPMIREQCLARIAQRRGSYRLLVVPLMVESGHWLGMLDRLLVVDCTEDMQVQRVRTRSGLDADAVRAIMARQASRAQRCAAADDIIFNGGSLADLRDQAAALHARYCTMARYSLH